MSTAGGLSCLEIRRKRSLQSRQQPGTQTHNQRLARNPFSADVNALLKIDGHPQSRTNALRADASRMNRIRARRLPIHPAVQHVVVRCRQTRHARYNNRPPPPRTNPPFLPLPSARHRASSSGLPQISPPAETPNTTFFLIQTQLPGQTRPRTAWHGLQVPRHKRTGRETDTPRTGTCLALPCITQRRAVTGERSIAGHQPQFV